MKSNCLDRLSNPYIIKFVLLGDKGVGKSTILHLATKGTINMNIETTIAMDFYPHPYLLIRQI
jgi:GTPase SAR1 family protein